MTMHSVMLVALLAGAPAAALATPSAGQAQTDGWQRIEQLEPGTSIQIEKRDGRHVKRVVGDVRADGLVVLDFGDPRLSDPSRQTFLLRAARNWPGPPSVSGTTGTIPSGIQIDREGVVVEGNRITGAIQTIDRGDIMEIRRGTSRWWGLAVGGGAGFFAGFVGALNIAFRDCGDDCGAEKASIGLLIAGVPAAAAATGYYLGKKRDVIYRAPAR